MSLVNARGLRESTVTVADSATGESVISQPKGLLWSRQFRSEEDGGACGRSLYDADITEGVSGREASAELLGIMRLVDFTTPR